jgi:SM-20-related protein
MLSAIVDDLATRGWSQQTLFLPDGLSRELAPSAGAVMPKANSTLPGWGAAPRRSARGHSWRPDPVDRPGRIEACDRYLGAMDSLRQAINQGLFLGLEDFECHCPVPAGAFYRRHLDRFRDDDRRTVSAVFYLNEGWQPDDGGQLRMFLDGDVEHDVQPSPAAWWCSCLAPFPMKSCRPGASACR